MPFRTADLIRWQTNKDSDKFIQILKYLDSEESVPARVFAVKALGILHDINGLTFIIASLKDNNEQVVETAKNILSKWVKTNLESVCKVIESPNMKRKYRRAGLMFLSKNLSDRVIDMYINLLKHGEFVEEIQEIVKSTGSCGLFIDHLFDKEPENRYAALLAMAKTMQDPNVYQSYAIGMGDNDVQVRVLATKLLADELYEMQNQLKDKFTLNDYPGVTNMIVQNASSADFFLRAAVADALGGLRNQSTLPILLSFLEEPYERILRNTLSSLKFITSGEALEPLIRLYKKNERTEIRIRIIRAISFIRSEDAFHFIETLFESEVNEELKRAVIKDLDQFDFKESFDLLLKVIESSETDYFRSAIITIGAHKDPRRLEVFQGIIDRDLYKIDAKSVVLGLRQFNGPEKLSLLIQLLGKSTAEDEEHYAIRAIIEDLDPETIEQFLKKTEIIDNPNYNKGLSKLAQYDNSDTE